MFFSVQQRKNIKTTLAGKATCLRQKSYTKNRLSGKFYQLQKRGNDACGITPLVISDEDDDIPSQCSLTVAPNYGGLIRTLQYVGTSTEGCSDCIPAH
jgi:hypothetical protein